MGGIASLFAGSGFGAGSASLGEGAAVTWGASAGSVISSAMTAIAPWMPLIQMGAGLIVKELGTLIGGNHPHIPGIAQRNPIEPWQVCYGRCKTGGTLIFENVWGENNQILDLIFVLACHPCQSVDELLIDNKRIQINTSSVPKSAFGPGPNSGTSFSPANESYAISEISRSNDVVKVVCATDIPWLSSGDSAFLENIPSAIDENLNGSYNVSQILSRLSSGGVISMAQVSGALGTGYMVQNNVPVLGGSGAGLTINITAVSSHGEILAWTLNNPGQGYGFSSSMGNQLYVNQITSNGTASNALFTISSVAGAGNVTFTVLNGGPTIAPVSTGLGNAQVTTNWQNYLSTIYIETMLGNQTLGQTFAGMADGTPWLGSTQNIVSPENPGKAGSNTSGQQFNPWTNYCSLLGKTAVFVRLTNNQGWNYNGVPQFAFLLHGKNNIYDPRNGPAVSQSNGVVTSGVAAVGLASPGSAFVSGDVLSLTQIGGSGVHIVVDTVDGSGAILTAFLDPNNQGTGYFVASGVPATGGHGSGAVFNILSVGSASGIGSVNSASPAGSGSAYKIGDLCQVVQFGAEGGFVNVTGVTPSGGITGVMPCPVAGCQGWGYTPANGLALVGGSGTGGQVNIVSVTGLNAANSFGNYPVGYSENSALCTADFLCDQSWGYKCAYGADVPLDDLSNQAYVCDTPVPMLIGSTETTEPMYACNGSFKLDAGTMRGKILKDLLSSCGGRLVQYGTTVGYQYFIRPAIWPVNTILPGYTIPTYDLLANADGPVEWKVAPSVRDLYNEVRGVYVSPDNFWNRTNFPSYKQDHDHGYDPLNEYPQYSGDINLAADLGERRILDIELPFTISCACAQRLAKIELLRRRQWGSGTAKQLMAAWQFVPVDVVDMAFSPLGWTARAVEIISVRPLVEKVQQGGAEMVQLGCEIEFQDADASVYEWSTEEQLSPQGYVQSNYQTGFETELVPYPWSPGYAVPLPGDAVGGPATFGLTPVYGFEQPGNPTFGLKIIGTPALNNLDDGIEPPYIQCFPSPVGGGLPQGASFVVGVSARSAGGASYQVTDYNDVCHVTIPLGSPIEPTGSIAVNINYGSGDVGADIYLALYVPGKAYQWHWVATVGAGVSSYTITGNEQAPNNWQSTAGGPDTVQYRQRLIFVPVIHSGVWAQQVQAVTGTSGTSPGTIKIAESLSSTKPTTANQYAGYTLSLLAKYPGSSSLAIPVLNMPVLSNTTPDSNGMVTYVIGSNAAGQSLPDLTTLLDIGDLLVMRDKATFTANGWSDPNIANTYYPSGDTGIEAGHVALMLSGSDAGNMQSIGIVNSGDTGYTLSGQWATKPNDGDLIIVCAPALASEVVCPPASFSTPVPGVVVAQPNVQNLQGQTWLLIVRTEDINGDHCPDTYAPMRDFYEVGSGGSTVIAS